MVDNLNYDLSHIRDIYVIGAGKGTLRIAEALEDILSNRIKRGIIIEKRGQSRSLNMIDVVEAGHPIPDKEGMMGAKKVLEIAKEAREGDLVFVGVMGGCSALMPLPARGISIKEKQKVTDLLLKCGATIKEINAVRKHISAIKGGRLATYIHPAEMINLIVIDEVAGLPWGPTVPDTTTFRDVIQILHKYHLWERLPPSVITFLKRGLIDLTLETPKPDTFTNLKVQNVILADNVVACEAAQKRGEELGFNSVILSTVLEGESREAGIVLASMALEVEKNGRPFNPPSVLIIGGETTVQILGESGEGGPSQELALGFSLKITGSKRIVMASIDTDGTDGPTNIAGAFSDGYLVDRAKEIDLDIYDHLLKHNSSHVLTKLQDAIITGYTGTNVMDLNVIFIS